MQGCGRVLGSSQVGTVSFIAHNAFHPKIVVQQQTCLFLWTCLDILTIPFSCLQQSDGLWPLWLQVEFIFPPSDVSDHDFCVLFSTFQPPALFNTPFQLSSLSLFSLLTASTLTSHRRLSALPCFLSLLSFISLPSSFISNQTDDLGSAH